MKPAKFKMTELGPIPADWKVKRLGDVAPLQRGFDLPISKLCHGAIPVVYSNGVGAYHNKAMCNAPGLITGRSGTIGRFTYIESGGYWPHNTSLWVTNFNGNHPLFVKYLFETLDFENFSTGTGVPTLNRNSIHDHLIPLPPLPEQRRIAAALSDVDDLIGALGKLIEKKRAIKTGAMQQLLTGQTRLPGFGGKKFKQTDLGPIPADWEVKRLGDVMTMLRNNTYAREMLTEEIGGVFNVHYGDVLIKFGAIVDFEKDSIPCLKSGVKPKQDFMQDGDLIFADTAEDETVGKACEVVGLNGRKAVSGLHTIPCRPNAGVFASGYLGYFINSATYHNQLLPLITGTKVSSISRAGLASTFVAIPPLPEQRAIAGVLTDMDAEISALETEKRKYESLKSGMMQQLLTGKVRLA